MISLIRFLNLMAISMLIFLSSASANIYVVTSINDSGAGTLREAITEANTNGGLDTINFVMPGIGIQEITLSSALPSISSPVFIDGYSQIGTSRNDENDMITSILMVGVNGGSGGFPGLVLAPGSTGSKIEGLWMHSFNSASIRILFGSDDNRINGNILGLNQTGTAILGDGSGVEIYSSGNQVGSGKDKDMNSISGNSTGPGILVSGAGAFDNRLRGSFIGLAHDGTTVLGGIAQGIKIEAGANNIEIGNRNGANQNYISGTTGAGIEVLDASTQSIEIGANIINNTGGLPIDLNGDGLTLNDLGDADSGPNGLLNYPVIQKAYTDFEGSCYAQITFEGLPNTNYEIDWYLANPNPFGHGGTIYWLGATGEDTDALGVLTSHHTFGRHQNVPVGSILTCTITDKDADNTSEFAQNFTFTLGKLEVTNTSDLVNGNTASVIELIDSPGADGISLREAILAANNNQTNWGAEHILFDIPGPGPHYINPTSPLPSILSQVNIEGDSEPDYIEDTPAVIVDGSLAGAGNGFNINWDWCEIEGLSIVNFDGDAIRSIEDYGNIKEVFIGVLPDGVTPAPNTGYGINLINARNWDINENYNSTSVISNNTLGGIFITGNDSYNIEIRDCHIGTDITGTINYGGQENGIELDAGAHDIEIGSSDSDDRCIISGNSQYGVFINGADCYDVDIIGNYIGTDLSGNSPLGNGADGVRIDDAHDNTIGGTNSNDANIISSNVDEGIEINGATAINNEVQGNFIGIGADGVTDLGNGDDGVAIREGAHSNTIGGSITGARNIISFNEDEGVLIDESSDNHVLGNYIGTDVTGLTSCGNGGNGINLSVGATGNSLGGIAAGNVISGNVENGIHLTGITTVNNLVLGNYIGIGSDGVTDVGNGNNGIRLDTGAGINTIGGIITGESNVISYNLQHGVSLSSVDGTLISSNLIGTDASGIIAAGNAFSGIELSNSNSIEIGTQNTAKLIIANNEIDGIRLSDSSQSIIQRCYIGTDVLGTSPLGNNGYGIQVLGSSSNNIIGTNSDGSNDVSETNVISGNAGGIRFHTGLGTANIVANNYIGTDATGNSPLANISNGIDLGGISRSIIGTDANGINDSHEGNIISGNSGVGIRISSSNQNVISGNSFGIGADGSTSLPNGQESIYLAGTSSDNIIGYNPASTNSDPTEVGNVFSNAPENAITVADSGIKNRISRNSFSNNGTLAIDLDNNLVSANDNGDIDVGPNDIQNFPVVETALLSGNNLNIKGFATPNAEMEIYLADAGTSPNPTSNAESFGEGETYLFTLSEGSGSDLDASSGSYDDDGTGIGVTRTAQRFEFNVDVSGMGLTGFERLTLLAIAPNASTSEFNLAFSMTTPEDCTDGVDNDGDGLIDCLDPDCNGSVCLDSDSDGISDAIDLDDDNDGITDVEECPSGGRGSIVFDETDLPNTSKTYSNLSGNNLSVVAEHASPASVNSSSIFGTGIWGLYASGGINGTSTISFDLSANPADKVNFIINHITAGLVSGGDEIEIFATTDAGTVLTNPVINPMASPPTYAISNGTATASATPNMLSATGFGSDDQQNADILFDDSNIPTGEEITSITLLWRDLVGTTIDHGIGISFFEIQVACVDTDFDGVSDSLDLDSDDDGCPDAIEADEDVSTSQLLSNGVIDTANHGGVDADGVPNLVNSAGAADGVNNSQGQNITTSVTTSDVISNITVGASPVMICEGDNVTLTATPSGIRVSDFGTTGGVGDDTSAAIPSGDYSYNWYLGASTTSISITSTLNLNNVALAMNGNEYRVEVTSSGSPCPVEEYTVLTVGALPDMPSITVTSETCAAAATNTVTNYNAALTYTSTPAGLTIGSGGEITGGVTGTSYTLTAENANTCSATSASFMYDGDVQLASPAAPSITVTSETCASAATNTVTNYNAALTYTSTPAGLTIGSSGEITGGVTGTSYTLTAENANTCSATSASFIYDGDPQIPGPIAPVLPDVTGQCTATATAPTILDNCGVSVLGTTSDALTYNSAGAYVIVWSFDDGNGTIVSSNQNVIIEDTTNPSAICQDITLNLDATGNANITANDLDNNSTDNCGIVSYTASQTAFTSADLGPNIVTLTVEDAAGNSQSCDATVTITDNNPPTAVCQNIIVELNLLGQASIVADDIDGGSFDNSVISSLEVDTDSFDCSNIGENEVELTVTDDAGNIDSCTAIVEVVDNLAPVITECPSDKFIYLEESCEYVMTDMMDEIEAYDNCTSFSELELSQFPPVGTVFNGPQSIECVITASDSEGNAMLCEFSIFILDDQAPVVDCVEEIIVTPNSSCEYVIGSFETLFAINDNCSTVLTVTQTPEIGTIISESTAASLEVTDEEGNTTTCEFLIQLINDIPPAVNCLSDQVLNLNAECFAIVPNYMDDIEASANCSSEITSLIQTPEPGTEITESTIVMITATDSEGNISSCQFAIDILNNTSPVIECIGDQELEVMEGCQAILPDYLLEVTISAQCGSELTSVSQEPEAGTVIYENQSIVITAVDLEGNISSCEFVLSLIDTIVPEIECQEDIVQSESIVEYDIPNYSDNCTAELNLIEGYESGEAFPHGFTIVTYQAIDEFGNADSCSFNVLVNNAPVAINDTLHLEVDGSFHTDSIMNNDYDIDGDMITVTDFYNNNENFILSIDPEGLLELNVFNNWCGLDSIQYTICDEYGFCDEGYIFVHIECNTGVIIPEGFSPNGDGQNDVLEIVGIEFFPNNNVKIFNRWGALLYDQDAYNNEWDGIPIINDSRAENRVPTGTYFILVDLGEGSAIYKSYLHIRY